MTTQLTFAEEFRYDDASVGITIPVIAHCGEKSLRFHAKVDTGAEVCLFRHEQKVLSLTPRLIAVKTAP